MIYPAPVSDARIRRALVDERSRLRERTQAGSELTDELRQQVRDFDERKRELEAEIAAKGYTERLIAAKERTAARDAVGWIFVILGFIGSQLVAIGLVSWASKR